MPALSAGRPRGGRGAVAPAPPPTRRTRPWAAAVALASLPGVAAAHGQSKSLAECALFEDRAELRVTFAAHDLLEALPELDRGRDGRLDGDTLDELARHVERGTSLDVGGARCRTRRAEAAGIGDGPLEVQVRLELECPAQLEAFTLELRYLPGLAPPHLTRALITSGATRTQHTFSPASPRVRVERARAAPPGPLARLRRADPLAVAAAGGAALAVLAVLGVGAALALRRRRR